MKKKRKKETVEKLIASCEGNEKGLHMVHTGNGKGKTSAAMNMVYRHLAHNMPAVVVQFVKCEDEYPDGDRRLLMKLSEQGFPVTILTMGTGFSWNSTDKNKDIEAAENAFKKAGEYLNDQTTSLVLLDEVHIAISLGYLDEGRVLEAIKNKPNFKHVVTTGRRAPESFIENADLVTEMKQIKHPMSKKIPAQIGIEY
jgi:cob(I)alamin adenosyltransferase